MSEAVEARDFFRHVLQAGDVAAAVMGGEVGGWLAMVRVEKLVTSTSVLVHVLDAEENPGYVPWQIWHRKLIWVSSDYAYVDDIYLKDIFNESAD